MSSSEMLTQTSSQRIMETMNKQASNVCVCGREALNNSHFDKIRQTRHHFKNDDLRMLLSCLYVPGAILTLSHSSTRETSIFFFSLSLSATGRKEIFCF